MCKTLIDEAESECQRCQDAIDDLCEDLRTKSDPSVGPIEESEAETGSQSSANSKTPPSSSNTKSGSGFSHAILTSTADLSSSAGSSSELSDAERAEIWDEVAAFELENTHWARVFTTRCQEKASVKKAVDQLMKLRRDRSAERNRVEKELLRIQSELPMFVATMQSTEIATEVALELSTNASSNEIAQHSPSPRAVTHLSTSLITPAQRTRRMFEREGWQALTLEEQQWVTIDRAMFPDKYDSLLKQQHEGGEQAIDASAKRRPKLRKNPAIDQCRFHRDELKRILAEPFGNLNRREIHVRKLVTKFHDDPDLLHPPTREESTHHDSTLARRTRLKSDEEYTVQEQECVSLDKILNPQVR